MEKLKQALKNLIILVSFSFAVKVFHFYYPFNFSNKLNISILLITFFLYFKLIYFSYKKIKQYRRKKYLLDNIRIKSNPYQKSGGINCHFYSKGSKIKIGSSTLKNPLIYITESLDLGAGEYIPFLVFSEMNLRLKNNSKKIDKNNEIKNYVQLTQAEKKEYLRWLSTNKKGKIKNVNLIKLYIKGLEYRFLKEKKDKKIIFQEVSSLLNNYKDISSDLDNDLIDFLLLIFKDSFILDEIKDESELEIFLFKNKIYPNTKQYHLIRWNYLNISNRVIDYSMILSYYFAKEKRFFNYLNSEIFSILEVILKYSLEKDITKKYKIEKKSIETKSRNFVFNNIEYSLHNSDKIKKVLDKITLDLNPFFSEFNKKGLVESYSLLPIKYKKIIPHTYKDDILSLSRKREVKIDDLVYAIKELEFNKEDKLNITDSKLLSKIINDNLFAIEPDAKYTNKQYRKNEYVSFYRNGNQLICKSKNFKNKQYLIDLVCSVIGDEIKKKEVEELIKSFFNDNFKSVTSEEEERTHRRIRLNLGKRMIDLRSVMSYNYESKDIKKIIDFLNKNKEILKVKDHRISKIKENLI